jgi:anti-sigma regulatory factor (Ser/Thr protein kinase)
MSSLHAYRENVLPDQTTFCITLGVESRLDHIRLVRAAMFGVLSHLSVAESDIHSLELAVTEIVNNSFEHGYKGADDKHIEVRLAVNGTEVQIDVSDDAPPFPKDQIYRLIDEPLPMEDPSENWPMRGHGLQIVRQIVDSISLTSEMGRNCITLKKHVDLEED